MKKILLLVLFVLVFTAPLFSQPQPPVNVQATELVSPQGKAVLVKWEAPAINPNLRFNIYRKDGGINDPGEFVKKFNLFRGLQIKDLHVTPGMTYTYYVTAVFNGESNPSNKAEVTVSPNPEPATISGFVFDDATLLPLKGASVRLIAMVGAAPPPVVTDSLGMFTISTRPGDYKLQVGVRNYKPEFYNNALTIQTAEVITVASAAQLVLQDIGLAPFVPPVTLTLTGTVTDNNNNPAPSKVTLLRLMTNAHFQHPQTRFTDSLGNFSFRVKEGDTVVVFAQPRNPQLLPEYYNDKATFELADRIVVTGNVTGINFVLDPRPVYANGISGVVADSNGAGIAAHILAFNKAENKKYSVAADSVTGVYSFANLVPGDYMLLARPHFQFLPTFFRYDGMPTMNWRMADSVVVTENGVVGNINFTLRPRNTGGFGTVRGLVKFDERSPAAGTILYVTDINGNFVNDAVSNMRGEYVINQLEPGEYVITAAEPGVDLTASAQFTVDYNAGYDLSINLSLNGTTGNDDKVVNPVKYNLEQNYPNPFNPATNIRFTLPAESDVTLKIYNLLGKEMSTLINGKLSAGEHTVVFAAGDLPSGVYFYQIKAGTYNSTKKLVIMK
jgi:hypothetical protein